MVNVSTKADLTSNEMYDYTDDSGVRKESNSGVTRMDRVWLNRPLKVVIAILIVAVLIPPVLYALMFNEQAALATQNATCVIIQDYWSECIPGQQTNKSTCDIAGCCWNSTLLYCYHSIPATQTYYFKDYSVNPENQSMELLPVRDTTSFGQPALPFLYFRLSARTKSYVTVQLSSKEIVDLPESHITLDDSDMRAEIIQGNAFWLNLWRRSEATDDEEDQLIFTTETGPLVASLGYWEVSIQFPTDVAILGSGAVARGSLNFDSGQATLYSGNLALTNGKPFLTCITQSGISHGVYFESSGALELVTRKSNLVSLRSTTDNDVTMHVFTANNPAELMQRYTDFVQRPAVPPYWFLGIHVCRDIADDAPNDEIIDFKDAALQLGLPYDSDCVDENLLGTNFILDSDRMQEFVKNVEMLQNDGRHFMLSIFPQVENGSAAYEIANDQGLLVKSFDEVFIGQHRNKSVSFVDFFNPEVVEYYKTLIDPVIKQLSPSGIVLADNWPLNEDLTAGDDPLEPIYEPEGLPGSISNGTIWWQATHWGGIKHHVYHAVYGSTQGQVVARILNDNTFLLSTSKWPGFPQSSWLGDDQNPDSDGLKKAVLSVLEAGLSGDPFSGGGSVCGFRSEWSDTVCTTWSLVAMTAFPFVRYHHALAESARDPTQLSNVSARIVTRAAIQRYELLPYLYTLAIQASRTGMPIVRPMAFEFATDNNTWHLDEQFMLGSSLMVAPQMTPGETSLRLYLPEPGIRWFHLHGGESVLGTPNNQGEVTLPARDTEVIVLIRAGHIITTQDAAKSANASLVGNRCIIAALLCIDSLNCSAFGDLQFLEQDGEEWNVTLAANSTSIIVSASSCPKKTSSIFSLAYIYGLPKAVDTEQLYINGERINDAIIEYDHDNERLRISNIILNWCAEDLYITIEWVLQEEQSLNIAKDSK